MLARSGLLRGFRSKSILVAVDRRAPLLRYHLKAPSAISPTAFHRSRRFFSASASSIQGNPQNDLNMPTVSAIDELAPSYKIRNGRTVAEGTPSPSATTTASPKALSTALVEEHMESSSSSIVPTTLEPMHPASAALFNALKRLRLSDRHDEVVGTYLTQRRAQPSVINPHVLDLAVASASKLDDAMLVLNEVEFAVAQGVVPHQSTLLTYFRSCFQDEKAGWIRAVDMVDKIRSLCDRAKLASPDSSTVGSIEEVLTAPVLEEVALICFSSGKWRRAIDTLHQMLQRGMPLSDRVLNSGIKRCAAIIDRGALHSAHELFKLSVARNVPLRSGTIAAMITGFTEGGMMAEAEKVWAHAEARSASQPLTDPVLAARISLLGHTGHADAAAEVMARSMDLKSPPKESIATMTNLLLKAGRVEEATAYMRQMQELKRIKITPQLIEYHLKALAQAGRVPDAIKFLCSWPSSTGGSMQHAWSELFNDCILLGRFQGAEMVLRKAKSLENSNSKAAIKSSVGAVDKSSSKDAIATSTGGKKGAKISTSSGSSSSVGSDSRSKSKSFKIDTTGWLEKLFTELGSAGQGKHLLHLARSLGLSSLSSAAAASLLRALCSAHMTEDAVEVHLQMISSGTSNPSNSSSSNSSSSNSSSSNGRGGLTAAGAASPRTSSNSSSPTGSSSASSTSSSSGSASYLEASHTLVCILARRGGRWREARQVIRDMHACYPNAASTCSLPSLFSRCILAALRDKESGVGQAWELWQLQRQLAVTPTWIGARYTIKALFMEGRWEACVDIYNQRSRFSNYSAYQLDQKTVRRVLRSLSNTNRWLDAVEALADYVTEAKAARACTLQSSESSTCAVPGGMLSQTASSGKSPLTDMTATSHPPHAAVSASTSDPPENAMDYMVYCNAPRGRTSVTPSAPSSSPSSSSPLLGAPTSSAADAAVGAVPVELVLAAVLDILQQHSQSRLIPGVIRRVSAAGGSINGKLLMQALALTPQDAHGKLLRAAVQSGLPGPVIARAVHVHRQRERQRSRVGTEDDV